MQLTNNFLLIIILLLSLTACKKDAEDNTENSASFFTSNHCFSSQTENNKRAKLIREESDLAGIYDMIQAISKEQPLPNINFDKNNIVMVYMGEQPTTGYSLALNHTQNKENTLYIYLDWLEPAANSNQAQVITYPCIGIPVEKGGYNNIMVVTDPVHLKVNISIPK